MANVNSRGPPPPPPVGSMNRGLPAGVVQVDNHPGQGRPGQFPGAAYPHQGQFPRQNPNFGQNIIVNNSTRISDITPPKGESEEYCRRQLTSYEAHTLQKHQSPEITEYSEERRDLKNSKSSKRPKATWERVTITQDRFAREDIVKEIRHLDRTGRSVTEKKAKLFPHQRQQVTNILDDKLANEIDPQNFEWTLSQLKRTEITNKDGNRETSTITLYLKRAPRPEVNVIQLYKLNKARFSNNRPFINQQFPPMHGQMHGQQQPQQQPQARPMGQMPRAPQNGMPGGQVRVDVVPGGKGPPKVYPNKSPNRKMPAGVKVKTYHHDESSSDSDSYSDSDSERMYGSDSDTGISSMSSGRSRRASDSPTSSRRSRSQRRHSDDYVIVNRPRRRGSISYVPEVPRRRIEGTRVHSYERTSQAGSLVDPATAEAFAAGFAAANVVASSVTPPSRRLDITYGDSLYDEELRAREERRRIDVEDILRRDSLPFPRREAPEYGRRAPLAPLSPMPLDEDRHFEYRRNPFAPRERPFRY